MIHRSNRILTAGGSLAALAVAALLAFGSPSAAAAESAPQVEAVQVLLLGDEGHHQPAEFFRMLADPLKKAGVELTYTQKLSDVNAENVAKYDGLMVFANIDNITPEAEKALVDFVKAGGGLSAIHCASFCFRNSPAYVELVGAQFQSHGMTEFETKIVAPEHEIMQGLSAIRSFDESYRHSKHNPDRTVLEVRSSESGPVSDPAGEPYTWVRTSGEGRMFYTAWGHDYRTWGNADFQKLLARGTRWSCGVAAVGTELSSTAGRGAFERPEIALPSFDTEKFTFQDVGAKIPNYTPGEKWGEQGEPITLMQNPLPAEQSVDTYEVPAGFRLGVWATEADGVPAGERKGYAGLGGKPVAMNWDEAGRLWVCETIDYPNELQEPGKGRDRIRVCEDTDHDGHADKFTVFAEGLSIPSTLVCYRGGVLVQDGQVTVYLKDTDGDLKADFRQELITGWALGDTHGGVSNFQYGPDNWIWAMQGYNNSQPVINGQPQQRFRQGFFRFAVRAGRSNSTAPAYAIRGGKADSQPTADYDEHTIRVDALEFIRGTNNNTWGLGFSEEGYVFGSTANGCPSVHMPIPARYYDAVSAWSPKTLQNIAPDYKFKTADDSIRQVDWHGGYTAGCGHSLYTARNYPKDWWNRTAFVCGPTGHLVGTFVLRPQGADYRSQYTFNAAASIDDWAAPIMAEVGPDGNVWVLDWYNFIVQHNPTPQGFKTGKGAAYESDLRDKRYGRVYRLLFGKEAAASTVSLENASPEQLIAALSNDNFFWRRTAQRLIVERRLRDEATLDALLGLVKDHSVDEIGIDGGALHALWTLEALAKGDRDETKAAKKTLADAVRAALDHPSGAVRHAAADVSPAEVVPAIVEAGLHKDSDPKVRLAALLRMAEGDVSAIDGPTLSSLIFGGESLAGDPVLLDAWTAAAAPRAVETLIAVGTSEGSFSQPVLERLAVVAQHAARSRMTGDELASLIAADLKPAAATDIWQGITNGWPRDYSVSLEPQVLAQLQARFENASGDAGASQAALLLTLRTVGVEGLDEVVGRVQQSLLEVALDDGKETAERLRAWGQAVQIDPAADELLEASDEAISLQSDPRLVAGWIAAMSDVRNEALVDAMLEKRRSVTPQTGVQIVSLLLSRNDWTRELLDAMGEGDFAYSELQLDQRQALLNHPDAAISKQAAELSQAAGAGLASNRQQLVSEWMDTTQMAGDVPAGIAMYKKHCSQCHQHGEMGVAIGPNLSGMAAHPKTELLVHILDPSRSVEGNFRTYQILTADGAVLTGMLAGESQNALRIIDAQAKEQQVLREDIEELVASPKSLMPEGFEALMSRKEMADLLTFLTRAEKYVPLSIESVATASSDRGLFFEQNNPAERVSFADWSMKKVDEVPFTLVDPQGGRRANIVMLRSPNGKAAAAMPEQVRMPVSMTATKVHILGGIAGWGFPFDRRESTSMIVRCVYADGSTKDYPLINGRHIADYVSRIEVPDSRFAFEVEGGRQVRYVQIPIDGSQPLQAIEFVKGEDRTAPMIFAVTLETAGGGH